MAETETTNRIAREAASREATARPVTWTPPTLLPEPKPQPGWAFRYIRISLMGQVDPTNASSSFREGWEPVKAIDHPELMHFADQNPNSRFKDNIEIGGLLLCKAPQSLVDQRRAYYERMANSQIEAVDNNFMRQQDSRSNMSLFADRKTEVKFGRGAKS